MNIHISTTVDRETVCVRKDLTWWDELCLDTLDLKKSINAIKLMAWKPQQCTDGDPGEIHTRPRRQTEEAADTSEPRIRFSFCGDGSVSRPNGSITRYCVFLSNEAWEFSICLKLVLNAESQSRRTGSNPVRWAIFHLQAISITVTSVVHVSINTSTYAYTTNGSRWELWNHVPHRKASTQSHIQTSLMLIRPSLHVFRSVCM